MRLILILVGVLICHSSYAKYLTIAVTRNTPPFVMEVDRAGHYSGFSVDIMRNICAKMNAKCQYIEMDFVNIFDAVMNDEVDLGIGNITITTERKKYLLFSLPYMKSKMQYITLSTSKINKIADIVGNTVGVEKSSLAFKVLEETYGKSIRIAPFTLFLPMMLSLTNGKIDVAFADRETVETWYANNGSLFKLIGEPLPLGQGYGIMSAKTNTSLMAEVNKALLDMQADGSYTKIYQTYFSE